jgi:hypothetical protein
MSNSTHQLSSCNYVMLSCLLCNITCSGVIATLQHTVESRSKLWRAHHYHSLSMHWWSQDTRLRNDTRVHVHPITWIISLCKNRYRQKSYCVVQRQDVGEFVAPHIPECRRGAVKLGKSIKIAGRLKWRQRNPWGPWRNVAPCFWLRQRW